MGFIYVILIFVICVGGGWGLFTLLANILFPKSKDMQSYKEPNITINNYTTENHLHVSKEDLKELSDTSNTH